MSGTGFGWLDKPGKYGVVSQFFHWSMALMFAWLFMGLGLELSLGLHAKDLPLTPTHGILAQRSLFWPLQERFGLSLIFRKGLGRSDKAHL